MYCICSNWDEEIAKFVCLWFESKHIKLENISHVSYDHICWVLGAYRVSFYRKMNVYSSVLCTVYTLYTHYILTIIKIVNFKAPKIIIIVIIKRFVFSMTQKTAWCLTPCLTISSLLFFFFDFLLFLHVFPFFSRYFVAICQLLKIMKKFHLLKFATQLLPAQLQQWHFRICHTHLLDNINCLNGCVSYCHT